MEKELKIATLYTKISETDSLDWSSLPHLPQNFTPGRKELPHEGQVMALFSVGNLYPQPLQNLASSRNSLLHFGQFFMIAFPLYTFKFH